MSGSANRRRSTSSMLLSAQWADIVQIVGTFGLAVFLVLYYVLVVQPRQQQQYDELRRSIDAVVRVVEAGQSMLSREQSNRLDELFVLAVAPELADEAERILGVDGATPVPVAGADALEARLRTSMDELLTARVRVLKGFLRRDGEDLAQTLRERFKRAAVVNKLATRAIEEWPYRSRRELETDCREALFAAMQKIPARR